MPSSNKLVEELKEALSSANNKLINRFGVIQDDIKTLKQSDKVVDEEIQDMLDKIDGNIDDLINKTKDLNDKLPS